MSRNEIWYMAKIIYLYQILAPSTESMSVSPAVCVCEHANSKTQRDRKMKLDAYGPL